MAVRLSLITALQLLIALKVATVRGSGFFPLLSHPELLGTPVPQTRGPFHSCSPMTEGAPVSSPSVQDAVSISDVKVCEGLVRLKGSLHGA